MTHRNTHNRFFLSAWWSVDLPSGWRGVEEAKCATISRQPRLGVLQVSAALKPEGLVTDQDLKDFAEEHIVAGRSLMRVEYKSFSGLSVNYAKDRLFWREWWLRAGNLMIYATYNVERGKEDIEKNDLGYIISSLNLLPPTS
ncbi:MAG TPA: hypothetical protein VFF39_19485 [Verrucomicrobiae bacterium]|nr:hypothetical protein [Verrucomicrobiae bacterium]